MDKLFENRKALVIGGTGGIGREVALGLAALGADLVVHGGSSKEKLEEVITSARDLGTTADGFLRQIKSSADAEFMFRGYSGTYTLGRHRGHPDILVCAFGPFVRRSLGRMDGQTWRDMTDLNLNFPGICISACLPHMKEKNWGRILLFGGTNTDTIRGFKTTAAYSAAKTALGVLVKSAALEGGPMGVTCNLLCPGLTDTENTPAKLAAYNRRKSPPGGVLTAPEVAQAALDILSNPIYNGAIISADRGLLL
ncbi:MAG: SDR family oxidoreductase [Treponema sp.]|nr:SDR family oxidoreductase [Treponema sp.]